MQERIEAETGQHIVVEAVPLADEQVEKILQTQRETRAAALKAAMDAIPAVPAVPEKPRKNLKVRPAGEHTGFQRPKVEKVADENLILGKLYTETPIPIRDALGSLTASPLRAMYFLSITARLPARRAEKNG